MGFLTGLLGEVIGLFVKMAPYLIIGLTVAGILSVVLRRDTVARHVGHPGVGSVVKASLLGVPLPLCSCGVVPTASYLKRAGASDSATMSFLISTPQTGVDSIAATYGMLGPLFAVFRPIAALLNGIAGGIVSLLFGSGVEAVESKTADEASVSPQASQDVRGKLRRFAHYAYIESVDDIALQFLLGLCVGGLIAFLLPDGFFDGRIVGQGLPAMLLMVVVGIPMYVCSTSSIPIAVALIAKGLSPGAAYVFLVAGPATNAATLTVLSQVLGKRQTALYVATLIIGSLVFGPVMEAITTAFGWVPPASVVAPVEAFDVLSFGPAIALAALILISLSRRAIDAYRRRTGNNGADDRERITVFEVRGMTCTHCAARVEEAIRTASDFAGVDVDHRSGRVRLVHSEHTTDTGAIVPRVDDAIRAAGYDPVGHEFHVP